MRPNRYEIVLWVLAAVLLVAPYPATLVASELTAIDPSCSGFLATSCAPSAWYLFLVQAQIPLIAAGIVLGGVALGVRAIATHLRGAQLPAAAAAADPGGSDADGGLEDATAADYDLFRRPPAG